MELTKKEFKEMYCYSTIEAVEELIAQGKIIVNSDGLINTQDNAYFCLKRKEALFKLANSEQSSNSLSISNMIERNITRQVAADLLLLAIKEKQVYLLSMFKCEAKEIVKRILYAQNPEESLISYATNLIENFTNISMYDATYVVNENLDKCIILEKEHMIREYKTNLKTPLPRCLRKIITDGLEYLNSMN